MAYRRSNGKGRSKKVQPSALTMTISTPVVSPGVTQKFYFDLSQIASIVSRRFYRQGINWAVSKVKVSSAVPGQALLGKIPTTWVASNAWEKAMSVWRKQQEEALEEGGSESMKAAFNDFKVFADTDHVTAGFAANLLPLDFSANVAALVLGNQVR